MKYSNAFLFMTLRSQVKWLQITIQVYISVFFLSLFLYFALLGPTQSESDMKRLQRVWAKYCGRSRPHGFRPQVVAKLAVIN